MTANQAQELAVYDVAVQGAGGLAWDGVHLWLADFRAKQLLCLDPASMAIKRRLSSRGTPGGLAWDGRWLWQAVFGAGVALGLDPRDGQIRQRAVLPEEKGLVQVAGLAWDGRHLWCCSQRDGLLYAVDVQGEGVARTLTASPPLGGLAWDGHSLWVGTSSALRWDGEAWVADAPQHNLLQQLSHDDGRPQKQIELAYWPMGLAWDGTHLWVSDSQHSKLHQLAI
jgi:hypothetical protein